MSKEYPTTKHQHIIKEKYIQQKISRKDKTKELTTCITQTTSSFGHLSNFN